MLNHSPFLCFLTDNQDHLALSLRYWAVSHGTWTEKYDAILKETGISKWNLLAIVQSSCRAYLQHLSCGECRTPLEVKNRSQYSPLSGRLAGSLRFQSLKRCKACATAARAVEARSQELMLEYRRAHLTQALSRGHDGASPIDYSELTYVQSFLLYSVLVAANAGWEDRNIAPLDSQPGKLAPTADLSEQVYRTLYEDGILAIDPASDPRAFGMIHEEENIDFSYSGVSWVLAPDARGRTMKDVFALLLARLGAPEPAAASEVWFMVAESECRGYFLKQCERYHFAQPNIYSEKVALAIRDFLPHFSIGQIWNVIFYVLKDLAALAQEKTYARQHIYNMIPGNIRRYLEHRLSNNKPVHPWRRPATITESWMTSILLDKVLGNGDVSFEVLTGQMVQTHVKLFHG